jgi:hypothetical protein
MSMALGNPQEEFAQLVEEIRLGWVHRIRYRMARGVVGIPHKPDIDISDLPVFYVGEMADLVPADRIRQNDLKRAWLDQCARGQFRLPYPTMGCSACWMPMPLFPRKRPI